MNASRFIRLLFMVMMFIICCPSSSFSYGLLTHIAIIDASWEKTIIPILKLKYPGATDEQIKIAHTYIYGGAIIPDIGYAPLGSPVFSHLVHYVRSGDFVNALLDEAHNINEYAFALGVLCHYESDVYGHPFGTNKAVALLFPQLEKKYGKEITFEEGRNQHSRVEFGFDMLQTARGNYQSNAYHDFIGFQVSDSSLERAFLRTYGIRIKDVFRSFPTAINVFRFSVKTLIPELTKDAWKIKNSFIIQLNPLVTQKKYYYKMNKNNYRKEFVQPRLESFLVSLIIVVLPKYGPLSRFKPKVPSPEAEKLFEQSFDSTITHYSGSVKRLRSKDVLYDNIDLDTGNETVIGEYKLADQAYYSLLMRLKKSNFVDIDDGLKKSLIGYYNKHDAAPKHKICLRKEKKITRALAQLNTT